MIVRFTQPITDIGPATALLIAAMQNIYAAVAKYSDPEYPRPEHPRALWDETKHKLALQARSMPFTDWSVACDATVNPPDLVEQRRLAVVVVVQPLRSVETYHGHYIMRRVAPGVVEVEARDPAG